ncbi:MAG: SDR family oxidoreductase, partial [Pseudomonadota bacterium]|nr:SDR family oxidoreductase [Pseudomonadota bacterium]
RVLVAGAYGLIGSYVAARLHADGHQIVGAGRSHDTARRRWPHYAWIEADFSRLIRPEDWAPLLGGIDAVVNCVGILQDSPRDDIRAVHVLGAGALFRACERAGIRRVVHVSAVGTDEAVGTGFARTKREAEDDLRSLELDWVILRPSLVVARNAWGGMALIRALAGFPLAIPLAGGTGLLQPVHVDEVTATVAVLLRPEAPSRLTLELGGPEPMALAEIVRTFRAWLGFAPAPVLHVPGALATPIYGLGDIASWLGWRPPIRTTAGIQLAHGAIADPAAWTAATGIVPRRLADALACDPATVQDRWYARLYLLKAVAILVLALYWIATGVIALGPGYEAGAALLRGAGFGELTDMVLVGSSALDILLGAALLVRRTAKAALVGMIAVSVGYLVTGTVVLPGLWSDPLGPLVKVLPILVLTLAVLGMLDER